MLTVERTGGSQPLTLTVEGCAVSEGQGDPASCAPSRGRCEFVLPVSGTWSTVTVPINEALVCG